MAAIRFASLSAGATTSASPAVMTLCYTSSKLAESRRWTNASRPFSLMARRPTVPSGPAAGASAQKNGRRSGIFFVAIYQIYSFNVISELEVRQETYFNFLHGASAEWPENAE
jgi:hypothetical protein